MRILAGLAAATLVDLLSPHLAHAADPLDFEIAARIGSATTPGWVGTPYGVGFGGRAGASYYGFYGGVSAIYYLGSTLDGGGFHTVLVGLEAGYTIKLSFVRIRPQVGFGDGAFTENAPPASTSVGNVYVEPGIVLLVPVGHFFVGADVNALILPSFALAAEMGAPPVPTRTYTSLSAHGQAGFFF